jgi:hypothetical protein
MLGQKQWNSRVSFALQWWDRKYAITLWLSRKYVQTVDVWTRSQEQK